MVQVIRNVCVQCSTEFTSRRCDARCCSAPCRQRDWYIRKKRLLERADRSCPTCATAIAGKAHANRKYCSVSCRNVVKQVISHGLTLDEYRAMLEKQDHKCAICGRGDDAWWLRRDTNRDGWHIDHDHETGEVRGILCPPCNLMIGYAADRPDVLMNAAQYLSPRLSGIYERKPPL